VQSNHGRYAKIVSAASAAEIKAVETPPEGERNATLNKAAFALSQLCAASWSRPYISEGSIYAWLSQAAKVSGINYKEVEKTIKSGIDAGRTQPRATPENRVKPAEIKTAAPIKKTTEENKIASRFELDKKGLWFLQSKEDDEGITKITRNFVCGRLEIVAAVSDEGGINEGRLVRFKNSRGNVHELTFLMGIWSGSLETLYAQ
jgi:hypothetical protein